MRRVVTLILMVGSSALTATAASASCVFIEMEEWFVGAPVVFVGLVTATSDNDRIAEVDVLAVYKGQVSAEVVVEGGKSVDAGTGQTIVRSYPVGTAYMFVPSNSTSPFQDHPCSPSEPIFPGLLKQLLEVAGGPGAAPLDTTPTGSSGTGLVFAGIGAGLAVIGGLVLYHRSRPKPPEVEGFRLHREDGL